MKAAPTLYRDIRFASKLETQWARFFDLLDVPWEYEKEQVNLGTFRYTPDFWLPHHAAWVETKGTIYHDAAGLKMIKKCELLAIQTQHPVILAFNEPLKQRCAVFSPRGKLFSPAHFTACPDCGALCISVRTEGKVHRLCPYRAEHVPFVNDRRLYTRLVFEAAKQCSNLT